MVRNVGAVVAGMVVLGVVVLALQYLSMTLYPPPPGIDPANPADAGAFEGYLGGLPLPAWGLVFCSEVLGAFAGAWTAGRIAARRPAVFAGIIIAVAVAGSVNNWVSFPHPIWFMVGQLIAYPLAFFGAVRLLRRAHDAGT